jgi:hypothetical protein
VGICSHPSRRSSFARSVRVAARKIAVQSRVAPGVAVLASRESGGRRKPSCLRLGVQLGPFVLPLYSAPLRVFLRCPRPSFHGPY